MTFYRQDPRATSPFGLAILEAITTFDDLADLRRALVLKGGAALLLAYGSGRATRKDLDFDVREDPPITEDHILRLLAHLRTHWNATFTPTASHPQLVSRSPYSLNVGPIDYSLPGTRDRYSVEIQISLRRIPPYLAQWIQDRPFRGFGGRTFMFAVMPLESIAAEKAFRSLCEGGPLINDLYDLGYISEYPLNMAELTETFETHRRNEAQKLARGHNDPALRANYKRIRASTTKRDLFQDERVIDPAIDFATARARSLAGVAFVRRLVGLPEIK